MGVGRGDRGQLGMGGADRDDKDDDFHGKDEDESEKRWLRGCGGGCVEIIVVGWIWKDVKSAKLGMTIVMMMMMMMMMMTTLTI